MKIVDALKKSSVINGAMETLAGMISTKDVDSNTMAFVNLLGAVIWADGKIDEKEMDCFRELLSGHLPDRQIDSLSEKIRARKDWNISDSIQMMSELPEEKRHKAMEALVKIAFFNGSYSNAQRKVLKDIAEATNFPEATLQRIEKDAVKEFDRRARIMRSWTGIIVALVIVLIFILTATFLKSVLFGFILAFIFTPVESYFERHLESPGPIMRIFQFFGMIFRPFKSIAKTIQSKFCSKTLSEEQIEQKKLEMRVNKAVGMTALTSIILGLVLMILALTFSVQYVAGIGMDIKSWADKHVQEQQAAENTSTKETTVTPAKNDSTVAPAKTDTPLDDTASLTEKENEYVNSLISTFIVKLESVRKKIEKWPVVEWSINEISNLLKDKNNQKAMAGMVLKKLSGMFSFTAGFFSGAVSMAFDALMSLFFFLLFLQKLAMFRANSRKNLEQGEISDYIVKSIFDSSWMPYTGDETRAQAKRILDDIGMMSKTWLKGYLSIIVIESIYYITAFLLLGVPYAPILGFLAGCTILLPYIGPISSVTLTVLVCLALGNHISMVVILVIILLYIIMNGVFEQFFIYPGFVGEALGLTNLETIIVVLLGGLFAGLAGMIFAVPTAAVIKYIIPKIYQCWQPAEKTSFVTEEA